MNRRHFLTATGVATTAVVAGCINSESGTSEEDEIEYDINPDNFRIVELTVSRNAPDKVGATITLASEQFSGADVGVEIWLFDEKKNEVFHKPVFGVGLDGGEENTETCWFHVDSWQKVSQRLIPKARIRTSPPK